MDDALAGAAKQTPRFEQKREMILNAAARLIHLDGVDGVTLSGVGARVGLATNSVTYYYRRKENLVAACFQKAFGVFEGLIAEAARQPDVAGRVGAFLDSYFRLLAEIEEGRHSEIVNFSNLAALTGDMAGPVGDAFTTLFRSMRQLLRCAGDRNIDRARLNARTHLLLALSQWSRVWLRRYETDGYARAAAHVADIFLYGLSAPSHAVDRVMVALPAPSHGPTVGRPRPVHEPILTREQFLRAATRMINAHGFHGASVERISASLNATKGAFYHHNVDKQEMVVACFERSFSVIRMAQIAASGEANGRARLANAAAALVRFQLSDQGPLLRIVTLTSLPARDAEALLVTMNRLSERFASFVIDGMIDGSIRPVDPTAASQMLQGMISAAASTPRWAPGISPEDAVDYLLEPLLYGICSEPRQYAQVSPFNEALADK